MKKGKLLLAFLFFLFSPLLFTNVSIEATNVPRFLVLSILLLITFFYWFFKRQSLTLPSRSVFLLLIGFYLVNIGSVIWSFNSADSVFESQKVFLGLSALIAFLSISNNSAQVETLFKNIVALTFVCCSYMLFDLIKASSLTYFFKYFKLSGHENLLSSFLFLLLPFSIFGLIKYKGKWRILSLLTTLFLLTFIGIIQTRSVLIALFISLLGFTLLYWSHKWKSSIRRAVLIGIGGITLIAGLLFFQSTPDSGIFNENTRSSLDERMILWNKTYQLIGENPVLGVGTGNWQYNYTKFGVEDLNKTSFYNINFKRPHNDFLWILSENGLPGFLIFLTIAILICRKVVPYIVNKRDLKLLLLFSTLVGLMVISFFSFPKERVSHIVMTVIIVALLFNHAGLSRTISSKQTIFLFPILLLGFTIFLGMQRLSGEFYTLKVYQAQAKNDPESVIKYGTKAISTFYQTDPMGTPINSYLGWGYLQLGQLDNLYEVSEKAFYLSPYDYKVLSNFGYILERQYYRNQAKEILLEAYRIHPNYEPTILNLSVLAFNQENYQESLRWLSLIHDYEIKYGGNLKRIEEMLERTAS